jgi:hypothetical protein
VGIVQDHTNFGTNTGSSLNDGSGCNQASRVSPGMMGSESSGAPGAMDLRGFGSQFAVEDPSRGDLSLQERCEERTDEHEQGQRQGTGHAHSASISTVTGSAVIPREGSLGVPVGEVFRSNFRSGFRRHIITSGLHNTQEQYQYGAVLPSHVVPSSRLPSVQGRTDNQA